MTLGVILSSSSCANDEVVKAAGHLAASQCSDLMLIGLAEVPGWIQSFAPMSGRVCISSIASDTQTELESELRGYVRLLPTTVAARYACCSGWSDPRLSRLLRTENCSTVVTSLGRRAFRSRRRLNALVRHQSGVLVMVSGTTAFKPAPRDNEPVTVAT